MVFEMVSSCFSLALAWSGVFLLGTSHDNHAENVRQGDDDSAMATTACQGKAAATDTETETDLGWDWDDDRCGMGFYRQEKYVERLKKNIWSVIFLPILPYHLLLKR